MINQYLNQIKRNYREHKYLVVLSVLPFIIWVSLSFSNNFEINGLGYYICFIAFLVLSLITPINVKGIKVLSIVCISIISYLLFIEGQQNDMFGLLYPYLIGIFCLYYLFLNMISIKKK